MKKKLFISIGLVSLFVLLTILLLVVDVKAIGPNESKVGFATINNWFHNLTGVNWTLYQISDIGGIPPIVMGISFGVVGLVQWIQRKNILKVDLELIILGIFYMAVLLVYFIFQLVKINYRPVLVDGKLESSYPSSHTILSITFMLSALVPFNKYIKNKYVVRVVNIICYVYMVALIVLRVTSGVHWFTDILGAVIIGFGGLFAYSYFLDYFKKKFNR